MIFRLRESRRAGSLRPLFPRPQPPLDMAQNAQPCLDILGRKFETAQHAADSLLGIGGPLRQHVTARAQYISKQRHDARDVAGSSKWLLLPGPCRTAVAN